MKVAKNTVTQRLTDIDPAEVSMVDKGANKRKFVIAKRDSAEATNLELFQKAADGDQDAIKGILKTLFEKVSDETLKELGLKKIAAADGGDDPATKTEKTEDSVSDVAAAVTAAMEPFMKKVETSLATMEKKVNVVSDSVAVTQTHSDPALDNADTEDYSGGSTLGGKSLRE